MLVYTEGLFLSIYLRINFTVGLIPSIKSLVKDTSHRTFLIFYFFSTVILSVYINEMFLLAFTNGYSNGKVCR